MADNLYSVDNAADKLHQHSGFTATITTSLSSPSTRPDGGAWDYFNINFWSSDRDDTKYYQHAGFTTTITTSITREGATGILGDVTGDASSNLMTSMSGGLDKLYQHSGFTTTITTSFTNGANPVGVSFGVDGNAYSSDSTDVRYYKYS